MAYTIRRTRKSLELTQGTTVIAFFALGFTRINSIKSFTVYFGFIILINVVLSLIYLPCGVILMESRKLEELKKKRKSSEEIEESKIDKYFGTNFSTLIDNWKIFIIVFFIAITIIFSVLTGVLVPERQRSIAMLSSYNRCLELTKNQKVLYTAVIGDD